MGVGVDIQEEFFSKKSTSSYNLSALIGADRFYFSAYDQSQKKVTLLRTYSRAAQNSADLTTLIHQICTQDDILQLPFKKCRVAIADAVPTYVPDRLFKAEAAVDYLKKMIPIGEQSEVKVDHLQQLQVKNIYALPSETVNLLLGYFPGAEVHHPATWFINGVSRISAHRNGHHLYLNVLGDFLQIVLFEGNEFLFSNQFTYRSTTDFVYFTMLIFEQFKLKPESVPVYIAGEILEDSEVYRMLYRYIRHLHFVQLPDFLTFGKKIKQLPAHIYFNLFCENLCE